jgi:hypothetical protein
MDRIIGWVWPDALEIILTAAHMRYSVKLPLKANNRGRREAMEKKMMKMEKKKPEKAKGGEKKEKKTTKKK